MGNIVNNQDVISEAKTAFIEQVKGAVNTDELKGLLSVIHNLEVEDADFQAGDIVQHDSGLAFKLDYKITSTISMIVDSNGNSVEEEGQPIEALENSVEETGREAEEIVNEWNEQK